MDRNTWRKCYDLLEGTGQRLRSAQSVEEQAQIFEDAAKDMKTIADAGPVEMAVAMGLWAALEVIAKGLRK